MKVNRLVQQKENKKDICLINNLRSFINIIGENISKEKLLIKLRVAIPM